MIRLGLRMAVAGGRAAVARLAIIGAAVAIGVGLVLAALAGTTAVQRQNAHYGWLNSAHAEAATGPSAADPAWWAFREDYFRGRSIARIDVAVTGPHAPVPPGLSALPGPGEYAVSPALAELLRTTPPDQLSERFPGRRTAVLGRDALASPDLLIAVVGRTPADVAGLRDATQLTRFVSVSPEHCLRCYVGTGINGMALILAVVVAALLFPLLIFIGVATRLSAARREQRLAAMRLVGATPRQVATLATIESMIAATAGTLLGFGLFLLLRPVLAHVPFTGLRFFLDDLELTWPAALLMLFGVPIGAALSARLALRRVRMSPLGVMRRVTPKPPRAWRLLPLIAGLAELTWFVGRKPYTTNGQTAAYLSGILVVMIGVVVAGPWVTMTGSRLLARLARRPAGVIAGRRLADDPRAGFRSISGLALALFVGSVATGVITSYVAERGDSAATPIIHNLMTVTSWSGHGQQPLDQASVPPSLTAVPGVRAVVLIRDNPQIDKNDPNSWPGLISCADLTRIPGSGHCSPGAAAAQVFPNLVPPYGGSVRGGSDPQWPPAPEVPLDRQAVIGVAVDTDGSPAALETSRTLLENAFPQVDGAASEGDIRDDSTRLLRQMQRLADIVIIASLVIAGCSLAVSITGGLNERKRPFAVLRLAGLRLSDLRGVVLLESAVPLLAVSAVAVAAGFVSAALFLKSQLGYELRPPGAGYYAVTGTGLLVSLALIASTMPLLRRLTGPASVRND
ncbi:ABC transporter permease [Paractinoplanes ferrugineus]|uniref:ABC3 transporter permease C-terminal domain-containing protein n=1 Tax=Paractinoplanes ferrugineus TaxID=113564 RepID=A0A919J7F1_9ACTN|nr:FtsX-like permease family protein [Actinoplanes ferrugineus]GIE15443.1 hypothetical protein Afe05nite_72830 [Actinoplanes ferrugineus]